ncbi:MAG: superoxide dismutase, Ni [Ardenticatenaceae bacterium]|nr:superoxide dismutase, Ni [Anaerolineales bacterium]MCB8920734.1 superoxide dismutase, Ni [Ardenticatenaceae bacterium]MCB8989693.1 superoxide dismutase, Ni [Ardenticatenaceae bacterium]MCB9002848.1 superoxide dismutase, Ni [Ardenticatenaceae bacterium]
MKMLTSKIKALFPAKAELSAHCDGPCGVYDPASARIAAEAVVSMTKKMIALEGKTDLDSINNMSRYIAIKEEQAHIAKTEILVLWTDYFKPAHLEQFPELHDVIWETTKLLSHCKQHVDVEATGKLMEKIQQIHSMFWATKGRDVTFYVAS